MTLFQVLLLIHILAVVVWLGGAFVALLIGGSLRRSGNTPAMAAYCAALAHLGGPVFGGSSLITLVTGIWMVGEGYPDWSMLWVNLGFGLWLVSTVMGAAFVGRSWHAVGIALAEPGASIDSQQPMIGRAVVLSWIDLAIRTLVVVVMVWRPVA